MLGASDHLEDPPPVAEQQTGSTFIGRERELRELLGGLAEAESGRGRLVLIAGEPGIGKSRLADELATRARQRQWLVLWGRGWEDAGAPAYWPWIQALRPYLRASDPADLRRQMGSGASDIAQILPELRDLFADLAPPPAAGAESARFQLFDSTATFLHNVASERQLLLVVDDLQAADTPSILFLRFLASQLANTRMLVVGTYRDLELTPDHPLTAAIGELAREPTTRLLTLSGLGRADVAEFIGATAGVVPHDQLVAAVSRETKGNPLFVGEAVRLLSAEGGLDRLTDLPGLHVAVPPGVRNVIGRRIGHLGEAAVRVLSIGALLGPEFRLDVLRRVTELELDALLDVLDRTIQAGLMLRVTGALGRFRFAHDLVRETLYDDLAPGQRARLHRRVAEVLEEFHRDAPDPHLPELAHHFYEATLGGEAGDSSNGVSLASRAADYARRAGAQAARSLAYEEAARLYRMALALLDLDGAADAVGRTELLLALGDAEARAGDLQRSHATLFEAAEIARSTGMVVHLARAALGFGARLPWSRPGNERRLIPLLEDALARIGDADDRLRVRLLARLACAWRSSPERRAESDALSADAVALARRLGDAATLSYALAGRYWAIWWPDNPDERSAIAEELLAIAEELGDGERLIDAHLVFWMTKTEVGQMGDAHILSKEVRRLAEELRQPGQLWLGSAPRAEMALMEGDYALAEQLIQQQTRPGFATLANDDVSAVRMQRFLLRREQGRLAGEEEAVRSSVEEFPWYPLHRSALALLLLNLGRQDEARAVYADLATNRFSAFYRDNEWLLGMSLVSEASFLLGDAEGAGVLYDQLLPFAGRHAIGHAEGSVGAVDRYLGLLASTMGRLEDAERHLSDAVAINNRMGARPWAAHSEHDLAEVLRLRGTPGDRERAAGLDRSALATAREIGMRVLEDRIAPKQADPEYAPHPAGASSALLRSEGEYWTIRFGEELFRLRDSKGLRYLARLLTEAGREFHALDLVGTETGSGGRAVGEPTLRDADAAGAGPLLDPEAKAAYRRRLEELRDEVREADEWNDGERAARAREEMEFLTDELAGEVGLGGRDRKVASPAERARISVTRAIRAAMQRVGEQSPTLGAHLEATIRTGTYCSYVPDPRVQISWQT